MNRCDMRLRSELFGVIAIKRSRLCGKNGLGAPAVLGTSRVSVPGRRIDLLQLCAVGIAAPSGAALIMARSQELVAFEPQIPAAVSLRCPFVRLYWKTASHFSGRALVKARLGPLSRPEFAAQQRPGIRTALHRHIRPAVPDYSGRVKKSVKSVCYGASRVLASWHDPCG